jgi:hypothetical protein
MIDLTALTPFAVALVVFATIATGLAVVTIARLAVEAARAPKAPPVVLITTERAPARVAA